ncbi:hypothetical protein [Geodermatophilus sp. DSM 44513]|uniref:hypothetical protein n=1 Tax=Geodermatophilus sp. DSM 44513 TaxID=1528104 RepID=UPI0014133584|nr:hypothetical protein [Geodermatophilus sp. DSM 44513]WNV74295.1 hypothetical protein RTG05_15000 [Geodermatophilus sp. DSM 44513]
MLPMPSAMLPDVGWEDLSDFEHEMYWAVVEESSLAELPLGVTDVLQGGSVVRHGPWDPAACSAYLLDWLTRGLVELYDMRVGYPTNRPEVPGPPETRHGPTGVLPSELSRRLLSEWEHWGDDDELWMCCRLVVTDLGAQHLDAAVGLRP